MAGFKSSKSQEKRTICEVHREIYDIIGEHMPASENRIQAETKLEEAFEMAKKMNAKLRQYAYNYDDEWWEKESTEIRQRKETLRSQRNNNEN
jgi:hypothetical protein